MRHKKWLISSGLGVAALGAFVAVMLTVTQLRAAAPVCIQACNSTSSGSCVGSTTGSCPMCVTSGSCGDLGITFFTGNATYGSIMGSSQVSWEDIDCKKKRPCMANGAATGTCSNGYCNPAGVGTCSSMCQTGEPFVVANFQGCVDEGCPPS